MAVDSPIKVQVLGNKGYIWDVEGAKRVRLQHRILGAMVGGVAQFKNQNEVGGLPLELTANEVTLCLEKGWITLAPSPEVRPVDHTRSTIKRKQGWALDASDGDQYDDYYTQTEGSSLTQASAPASEAPAAACHPPNCSNHGKQQQQQDSTQQEHAQQQQQDDADDGRTYKVTSNWRDALSKGMAFPLPLLPSILYSGSVPWSYPTSPKEQLSYAIYRDLHNKGFFLTGGIKFGAEFLVYPGDPSLYHAQFTVRVIPWGSAIDPVLLKSIARGSHAARKHLLLASLKPAADGSGQVVPSYISVAPQLGFGHQNQ